MKPGTEPPAPTHLGSALPQSPGSPCPPWCPTPPSRLGSPCLPALWNTQPRATAGWEPTERKQRAAARLGGFSPAVKQSQNGAGAAARAELPSVGAKGGEKGAGVPTAVVCQPSTPRIQQPPENFPSGDQGCPLTLQTGDRAPQGCAQHRDGLLPSPLPLPLPLPLQETVTSHASG